MPSQAFSLCVATGYQLTDESVEILMRVVVFAFILAPISLLYCIDSGERPM